MKRWLRWILITLTIGGGYAGLVYGVEAMFQQKAGEPINLLLCAAIIVVYGFIIVSGLLFAENPGNRFPLVLAWVLQIPWFSSSVLTYGFAAGARLSVVFRESSLICGWRFGSDFQLMLFQNNPIGIGVNFFAILIVIILVKYLRTPWEV